MADKEKKKKKGFFSHLAKEFRDVVNKPSAFANIKAAKELAKQDKAGK